MSENKHWGHGTECPQCKSGKNVIYLSQVQWGKYYNSDAEHIHLCQKCLWLFDEYKEGRTI